jgi:lipopolysaccharide/colanic/teichoic acid biosynthesis glycosyltransferase
MDLSPAQQAKDERPQPGRIAPVAEPPPLSIPRAPRNGLAMSLERRRLQLYLALVVSDALILLASFAFVATVYEPYRPLHLAMLPGHLLLPLFQTIAMYNGTYSRDGLIQWRMSARRGLMALLVSALLLSFFTFLLKASGELSRVVVAASVSCAALAMTGLRYTVARINMRMWGPSMTNRLLIDAGGPEVRIPHLYRVSSREHGLEPDLRDPIMLDRLSRYLRNMDQVIVSCQPQDRLAWAEVLKGSGLHGEVISEFAREIGALGIVYHRDANLYALLVSTGQLALRARVTKRVFDVAAAGIGLLVLSPVLLACALAIKLEDGGAVFFRQRRMGRGNTFFDIYKFRSMREARADQAGSQSAARDDERTTRIGRLMRRTSVDELPQLINVLKGEMSIVGPRPHALGSQAGEKLFWEVDRKYWQRHCLRPGITGLAQVRGLRGATDTEADLSDRLQSDMEYVTTWSLWGDIKIVLSTLRVLVHHRAY